MEVPVMRSLHIGKLPHTVVLIGTLCLFLSQHAFGQSYCGSLGVLMRKTLNDRWTFRAYGRLGQEHSETRSNIVTLEAGAGYSLSKEAVIAVYAKAAHADYMHIGNKDSEISVSESISWRRASGFFFGLYFEQRRLFYMPSNYAKNVSFCGGLTGWRKSWERTGIFGSIGCQIICNMKSPNTKADLVQRLKLPLVIKKTISEKTAIGVSYTYNAMGDDQVYIGERDRMNAVAVSLDIAL